jgi:lipid A ethanolaminephosphotransferase
VGHGAPNSIAPKEQREFRFLVWMTGGFKNSREFSTADILRQVTYSHDFPFDSVMGAFGTRSAIYKQQFCILNKSWF